MLLVSGVFLELDMTGHGGDVRLPRISNSTASMVLVWGSTHQPEPNFGGCCLFWKHQVKPPAFALLSFHG